MIAPLAIFPNIFSFGVSIVILLFRFLDYFGSVVIGK